MDVELLKTIFGYVSSGWQGLLTVYVTWAVVKQFKAWQEKREREALGLKHNPSAEVHEAIEDAIRPLRDDIADLRADVGNVRDRVSRIEGQLNRP